MAKPGTAATASAHTNTVAGKISLRSLINSSSSRDHRAFDSSSLLHLTALWFHPSPELQLGPCPVTPNLTSDRATTTANGIQMRPSRLRRRAFHPSLLACHATA